MKKRKRNLKGTVLFTTVSVMALLILFLLGTLTLASASNNRAHKTYSNSQANYTARAAIDGFIEAMVRDEKVEAAVIEVSSDSGKNVINPKVSVSDTSLGHIGYIDNAGIFHEGEIIVENVGSNSYEYLDNSNKAVDESVVGGSAGWVKVDRVKITATARVGKEYETVVAYLNKRVGTDKPEPSGTPQVKGIQMLGGETFPAGRRITGGLGVSLESKADPQTVLNKITNAMDLETTLSFINSSVAWCTSTARIDIFNPAPKATVTPYSQTIITGNLWTKNDELVHVYYDLPGHGTNVGTAENPVTPVNEWTNKDVPYLYVDGCMYFQNKILLANDNNAPFNLFCGTIRMQNDGYLESTNLYLMDKVTGDNYTVATENADTISVPAGKNILLFDGTNLEKWAGSIATGTKVPASSVGGSVFCNGDLEIKGNNATIQGDLRVEGTLTVNGNLTVSGKVVVGKTITGSITCTDIQQNVSAGGGTPVTYTIDKSVPNEPAAGGLTEADFSVIDVAAMDPIGYISWTPVDHNNKDIFGNDADNPSVTRYYRYNDEAVFWRTFDPNDINNIDFTKAYDDLDVDPAFVAFRDRIDRTVVYTELDRPVNEYDLSNDHYFGTPVFYANDDGSTSIERSCKPADHNVKYYSYPAGGKVVTEEERNQIIADSSSTGSSYYRVEFDGVTITSDIVTSDTTYYVDATTWGFTEAEAIAAAQTKYGTGGGASAGIYPSDMTREAIYMKADGSPADPATKIITTISEARDALGLDATTGQVNAQVYKHIYSSAETDTSSPLYAGKYSSDDASEKIDIASYMKPAFDTSTNPITYDSTLVSVEGSGNSQYYSIKKNCMLTGKLDGVAVSQSLSNSTKKELHIDPQGGELNIVLNNFTTDGNLKIIVESGGHVNFYVVGQFYTTNQHEGVYTSEYVDPAGCSFDYTKDWGIIWYGAEGSSIYLKDPATLIGSFKMPYTTFESNVKGSWENLKITYKDEYGKTFTPENNDSNPFPVIVGNALFKSVSGKNAISNYYTATGADSSPADSTKPVHTKSGNYWDLKYLLGS